MTTIQLNPNKSPIEGWNPAPEFLRLKLKLRALHIYMPIKSGKVRATAAQKATAKYSRKPLISISSLIPWNKLCGEIN